MQNEETTVVTLANGKSYICLHAEVIDGKTYLFLMSTTKPVEIRFAERIASDAGAELRIINQKAEKAQLAQYLSEKYQNTPTASE